MVCIHDGGLGRVVYGAGTLEEGGREATRPGPEARVGKGEGCARVR